MARRYRVSLFDPVCDVTGGTGEGSCGGGGGAGTCGEGAAETVSGDEAQSRSRLLMLRVKRSWASKKLPSSAEEGWPRPKKILRSFLVGADGVVLVKISWPAPPRLRELWWLRNFLLDRASTPPRLRRGVRSRSNLRSSDGPNFEILSGVSGIYEKNVIHRDRK